MKKFVALYTFFLFTLSAFGATKVPISESIDWSDATHWLPRGVPANGDEVIIPEGYIVFVKKSIYKNSTPNIIITVHGILQFEPSGKLELGTSSTLRLTSREAELRSNQTGSELLTIGGEVKYSGSSGPAVVTGPVYTSIDTPPAPDGFEPIPLPIKLTHFAARLRNGTVTLTWQTAMEENASHFVIERSIDAIHWQPLTTLPVRGANTTYSYTDAAPLNTTAFYRLKLVDLDETFDYSPVAKVAAQAATNLQLGPNPTSSHLNISLAYSGSRLLQLEVLSTCGQLIKQYSAAATGYTQLRLEGFSRGQYYLVVKDGPQVLESRMFIVR